MLDFALYQTQACEALTELIQACSDQYAHL
jgi:hypothetical protein